MKVRKISIATRIFIMVILLFIASDVILGVYTYRKTYDIMLSEIQSNASHISACVADNVDGELLTGIQTEEDMESEAFSTIHA